MLHKDGSYLWILDRGIKICNEYGKPYRMIGTHKDITKEKEMREKIIAMQRQEKGLVLPGDNEFYQIVQHKTAESNRYKTPLILIMIEIDRLDDLKQTLGNQFSEHLRQQLSVILKDFIRASDFAYSLENEKFAIFVTQTEYKMAYILADRLREAIANFKIKSPNDKEIDITVSVGISEYISGNDVETFISNTAHALSDARKKWTK